MNRGFVGSGTKGLVQCGKVQSLFRVLTFLLISLTIRNANRPAPWTTQTDPLIMLLYVVECVVLTIG